MQAVAGSGLIPSEYRMTACFSLSAAWRGKRGTTPPTVRPLSAIAIISTVSCGGGVLNPWPRQRFQASGIITKQR